MAKRHPLSALFGDIPDSELADLAADIKANGLKVPVVLFEEMILDGWGRARACQIAGAKIETREFDPKTEGDPAAFAMSHNAFRRQMTPEMRAAALLKARSYKSSKSATLAPFPAPTLHEIAQTAGVSERTMDRIAAAEKGGLGDKVASGAMTPAAAEKMRFAKDGKPLKHAEKKPSKEAGEILLMQAEIKDLRDKNSDLIAELASIVAVQGAEAEQAALIKGLYKQIDALESQCNEHLQTAATWQREAMALRRKLGKRPRER